MKNVISLLLSTRRLMGVCALGVSTVWAAPITVNNHSFEVFNALSLTCASTNCAFNQDAIPDWSNTGDSGSWRPGNPANTAYFSFIPDGSIIAYTNANSISQTVAPTVQPGLTYTLEVEVGNRGDGFSQLGRIALVIGGSTVVLGAGGTAAEGGWITHTATYVAQPGDAGQSITIRLDSTGGQQGNFDNVRLNDSGAASTPIPEPGSGVAMLLGLGALAFRFRRR